MLIKYVSTYPSDTQGLTLLLDILESGGATWGPAFVPSPAHLTFAATVLIHPTTTTRASTTEEKEAPSAALRLLRLVNTHVGPSAARVDVAFSFDEPETWREAEDDDDERETSNGQRRDDTTKMINLPMANSHSLWSRAVDFWHAVGWAFNCSVLHPDRWERWRQWLEFMCEVMERDWNDRLESPGAAREEEEEEEEGRKALLMESLIFKYLTSSIGYGGKRRMLRAVFADGSAASLTEFREVFKHELRKPASEESSKKRARHVNLDEDEYGDYVTNDRDEYGSEDSAENPIMEEDAGPRRRSKRSRRITRKFGNSDADVGEGKMTLDMADLEGGVQLLGGFSSLALRQRLLSLLSNVASRLPNESLHAHDLYRLVVESVRHLPMPIFQAFVSPSELPYFSVAARTTLCEFLLLNMIEDAAPDMDEDQPSQEKLLSCFLPFAASKAGVADNAKVSIALESLLILLLESHTFTPTPTLKQAVDKGIVTRAEKAQADNKKNRRVEDVDVVWISDSADRLAFMVNDL